MTRYALRSALMAGIAAMAAPGLASDEASSAPSGDRDYLPSEIVVTGTADGYRLDDGSTATKTPTPLIDVPQGVNFLTADQLEDQSVRQLNEALRYVPGVSLETGEGHRDEVFIRGQETTADFYLDGLRDDAQYYRSLYNIERVEVLKGANALIFGRGAGGGAVNRVSKTARAGETFLNGQASVDTFGAFALLADLNQPLADNVALRVNGTYEEFDSHRDFYEGRFIGIAPTLTAQLGPQTRVTASYSYDDDSRVTDRGIPSFMGEPLRGYDDTFFGDPEFNRSRAKVHIARMRLDHSFAEGLSANASVQYADYDKIYANIVPSGTDGQSVTLGGYQDATERENVIGQANLVWQTGGDGIGSTLLVGVEATRQDTLNARRTVDFTTTNQVPLAERIAIPAFTLAPTSRSRDSQLETLSAYLQEQLRIGQHVEIVAGLRWDRFDLQTTDLIGGTPGDRVDEKVSPRLGLIVKPDTRLSLYASFAESFLPQAGDQFLILSPGDTAFEPEKFTNYEIGLKWSPLDDLLITAAAFRLDRTNTQAPAPDRPGVVVLAGESRVEGFEIGAAGSVTDFWQANIGYTYLDGELRTTSDFGTAGARLQQLPRHHIAAWNRFDLNDRLGFGLGVVHQSEQYASFSNTVVLPAYWRVDAAAYFTVNEAVSVQLNIENLFDETYYPSAHGNNNIQPAEPFSARIGVRFAL
ncbi:TonB-dependent receptor [Pelagerythrobacter marensis]|uniref:Putative TonB-dependent receptor n=1 Tax=Pelagerythrobacter marensis TaxID=543877 RepID=A0A0G3X559_9SPHN|nr:TonB-dependent siderophore receptor [Pelagerythrobacter marensis]AKM06322.1 Putative TonB-dependent receptor [Pelagerythrobacter marensis]